MSSGRQPRLLGARVRRVEDPRFLMGKARYIEDIELPGMIDAAFVRSPFAHADILSVDVSDALAVPGVVAALSGQDLAGRVEPTVCDAISDGWQSSECPALAIDRVRYAGEAVAVIAAEDRYVAEDGAALVDVDYEPLTPLASVEAAQEPAAPLLHEGWKGNYFYRDGHAGGDPDLAFADAYGVLEFEVATRRHGGIPMEGRGCIALYDPIERVLTMWSATQIPHLIRSGLATCLGLPENRVRVIAPDVGGGFGPKSHLNPEEVAACVLAMDTRRPVRWIEDRREHMLACFHSREHYHKARVAYSADGEVLALSAEVTVDCGAYSVYPWTAALDPGMSLFVMPGPYRIRNFRCETSGVATNKCPYGAYRGVARPANCLTIERAMDAVADAVGMDPVEVRRRNLIRDDEFPYTSVSGFVYDNASLIESLDKVCVEADYEGMRERQRLAREEGRLLGIGVVTFLEQTAPAVDEGVPINFRYDSAIVRLDPSGSATVQLGTHSHGQGHETTIAQIVADQLTIPMDRIRILYGDTQQTAQGIGTFASRTAVVAGGAAHIASGQVKDMLVERGAHLMEAAVEDVELVDGRVAVRGSGTRGLSVAEVARATYYHPELFPFGWSPLLEAAGTFDSGHGTYANASQIVLVEVDPETGAVEILEYHIVEDCGQMINPTIVEGQIHGGAAQGIGGAFYEELIYDEEGQLLTTTFMDYLIPGPTELPDFRISHLETPSPTSPNGIKGVGEGGAIAPYAIMAAAVQDAIRPIGEVFVNELPLTPERVLGFIDRAAGVTGREGSGSG